MDFSVLHSLSVPCCIINSSGEIVFRNESFTVLTGSSESSELTLDDSHELFNEYRKKIALNFSKTLSGLDTRFFVVLKGHNNKKIPAELYLYPMLIENERSIALIIRPVEDRVVSFDRSMQNPNEHASLYDYSPCPVVTVDTSARLVRISSSAENYFGTNRDFALENPDCFLSFFTSYCSEKLKAAVVDICNGSKSFVRINDLKVNTKTGVENSCNAALYKIDSDINGHDIEIVFEDTTRLKMLESKLSKMNRVQIFSDMTKGLLHSFNNLINVIINRSQMLSQLTDKPNILDGLQSINESAVDAATQIRRIQEFITSDSVEYNQGSVEIIELIRDAIEFASIHFKVERKEKGRSISISKLYYTKARVAGNLKILREIVVSMIFRISSYIGQSGAVDIELKKDDDIIFTVSVKRGLVDNDPLETGEDFLPEIELRRIADKINVRIIEEESADIISLSAVIPAKMIVTGEDSASNSDKQKIRDCDILIVEDEFALTEILYELFDFMGNRVIVHEDAESGLNEFKNGHFDIVISDYGLKGMTGTELLTEIRELRETTLTVLLTGWMIEDIKSYNKQIDLFLQKPFQIEVLLNQIALKLAEKKNKLK
ncbi:MAG TPA: response regulator [Spirochaetota bacterium]|nr:response regulator [Spirochaetota bacterium]